MRKISKSFLITGVIPFLSLFFMIAQARADMPAWIVLPGSNFAESTKPMILSSIALDSGLSYNNGNKLGDNGFAIHVPDLFPDIGTCGSAGAIYMDFKEPNAKYFYATALAAIAVKRPVSLTIKCENNAILLYKITVQGN